MPNTLQEIQRNIDATQGRAGKPGIGATSEYLKNDPYYLKSILQAVLGASSAIRPGGGAMPYGYKNNITFPTRGYVQAGSGGKWGSNEFVPVTRSRDVMNRVRDMPDFPMSGPQRNVNPNTGIDQSVPNSFNLRMNMRQNTRNPASRSSTDAQEPMRAHDLQTYEPEVDQFLMYTDMLSGNRGGPGGNVLVPANRTPAQEYTAAEIIQQNPELARHLGLLNAIKGR